MKTLIIGGGLLGLSSAQLLLEKGSEVEILDAREGVGLEASFANGGLLTAAMSAPWNEPGVYRQLLTSLLNPHAAMRLGLGALPSLFFWGLGFLRHASVRHYHEACTANYRLANYSINQTNALRNRLGLQYGAKKTGALKLFRDPLALATAKATAEYLADYGLPFSLLDDADATIAVEPQLTAIRDQIVGALHFPQDECGDAHLFCCELEKTIKAAGGTLRTGVSVKQIRIKKGAINGVETNNGFIEADRVLVTAGVNSPGLLKGLGISLPVKPVKGYSISLNVEGLQGIPQIPVIDDVLHVVITPIGDTLRVVGFADFEGFNTQIDSGRIKNLLNVLKTIYPDISAQIEHSHVHPWAGLRPMSNDGKPFIGQTKVEGLYLNTGHGHLGWTMAVGSAHLTADLIMSNVTDIDAIPYKATR